MKKEAEIFAQKPNYVGRNMLWSQHVCTARTPLVPTSLVKMYYCPILVKANHLQCLLDMEMEQKLVSLDQDWSPIL